MVLFPNYEKELARKKGFRLIAGVDEAGRGPLAGPIVAAAVILPLDHAISDLNDSKKLSPRKREQIFGEIREKALCIGISSVSHTVIDRINIGKANLLVMKRAVQKLKLAPDFILLDGGRYKLDLPIAQEGITGGDGKYASIAAASIIAKVTRDRLMRKYHEKYPLYNFARHKGYGTREHFLNLERYGMCAIHRLTFLTADGYNARQSKQKGVI